MSKKKLTPRQQVAEWMEENSIPTDEEHINFIFDNVNYYQRTRNLDLRYAYLVASMVYQNNQAEQFLEEEIKKEVRDR